VLPFVRAARSDETILELAGGTVSDYRGSIVRTEAIPSVAEMVRRVLVSDFRDCARLRLGDLQPADVLLHIDVGSDRRIDPQPDPCPVLLRDGIPSRMIANVSYYRRRAERRGRVTFDVATLDRLDEFVAALFRLHAARWSHRGQPGVLVDRAVQAFHCEVIREMARAGALALTALRIDGVIAAIAYCLRVGGRTCYYLGGFDPRFADLSPGTLVLAEAVDRAWRDGAIAFDFLRGRERYKYLWGAVDRSTFSVDARLG
jgi:CelD/BcsL family acetyltransferase involved in cellulose biosynthesis